MADTTVEALVTNTFDNFGLYGPYYIDVSVAIIVFVDDGLDLSFARTTDKGATWATTQIVAGQVGSLSCWFDQSTPGDSGNLIHVAWLDEAAGDALYVTIDVSSGSIGTIRTIDPTITVHSPADFNRLAITKAVGGNLIVAFSTQTEIETYRSVDAGVNWVARADFFETAAQEDWVHLFPANTGDSQDVMAVFWDRSANEVSIKMYDDSGNSITETSMLSSMTDDPSHTAFAGVIRHSDKHVLIALHSNDDSTGDDLLTVDITPNSIASPSFTSKTNIFTDQAESAQVGFFINQQNDDVYVGYLKGGTWSSTVNLVFHKSTDGMGTWGAEQAYSEATADDLRLLNGGHSIGDGGGRMQWSFYNDDISEIYINEVNDIEIAAAVGGGADVRRHIIPAYMAVNA